MNKTVFNLLKPVSVKLHKHYQLCLSLVSLMVISNVWFYIVQIKFLLDWTRGNIFHLSQKLNCLRLKRNNMLKTVHIRSEHRHRNQSYFGQSLDQYFHWLILCPKTSTNHLLRGRSTGCLYLSVDHENRFLTNQVHLN